MERKGWICRRTCPSDRRKKLIYPTPRVKPVWSKIVACARRVRTRATKGIPPRELERLKELLRTVQQNLRPANLVGETA
jgi:MarR family transcriptional regulator for hemolysin